MSLGELRETGRSRLSLQSPLGRNVGFITITAWTLEAESVDPNSHTPSNATPHHQPVSYLAFVGIVFFYLWDVMMIRLDIDFFFFLSLRRVDK